MGEHPVFRLVFVENERGEADTVTEQKYQQVLVIFERKLKERCGGRQVNKQ